MTSARRELGAKGEDQVAAWYESNGYSVVDRNWRCRQGELDLVARRGRRLVFCEVKGKTGGRYGDPLEMVDAEKQRRVRRAAAAYLAAHPQLADLRVSFDVVADRAGRLERVREAF